MAHFSKGDKIEIGNNSGIGISCDVSFAIIGDNVMMGPEVVYLKRDHCFNDIDKPMAEQGYQDEMPLIVEDDVWVGTRAIILPNIKIGKGAIVGAGAVVTKDVPRYAIVAGNPARVVRYRNQ